MGKNQAEMARWGQVDVSGGDNRDHGPVSCFKDGNVRIWYISASFPGRCTMSVDASAIFRYRLWNFIIFNRCSTGRFFHWASDKRKTKEWAVSPESSVKLLSHFDGTRPNYVSTECSDDMCPSNTGSTPDWHTLSKRTLLHWTQKDEKMNWTIKPNLPPCVGGRLKKHSRLRNPERETERRRRWRPEMKK